MKKRIILIVLVIIMITVSVISFAGCAVPLKAGTEMEILQVGVDAAMKAEFYFYEEVDNRDKNNRVNTSVNITGKVNDKNEPTLDNGEYIDYNSKVYKFQKTPTSTSEFNYIVGKTSTNESILTFDSKIKVGSDENKIAKQQSMTTTEFVGSEFFNEYKLSNRVQDLEQLTMDYIDLEAEWTSMLFKETASFKKANELISMKFVIHDEFFNMIAEQNKVNGIVYENGEGLVYKNSEGVGYADGEGVRSVLEGDMIHIELAYGKLNNIIVYQHQDNDGIQTLEEVYRFSNVYKGPNIDIKSMKKINQDYEVKPIF